MIEIEKTDDTYVLILHDLGNLQLQIIMYHQIKEVLEEAAENINFLFAQAGNKTFVAEVHKEQTSDGEWCTFNYRTRRGFKKSNIKE